MKTTSGQIRRTARHSSLLEIAKEFEGKRLVLSEIPIRRLYSNTKHQTELFKPTGLWYAIGSAWAAWCASEMPNWLHNYSYLYRVLVDDSRILKITNPLEMENFRKKYEVPNTYSKLPNWNRIARTYQGIEISPYQWSNRLQIPWYYSWDVASGCIWDASDVKLELIGKH
jgi:hypothetical protein